MLETENANVHHITEYPTEDVVSPASLLSFGMPEPAPLPHSWPFWGRECSQDFRTTIRPGLQPTRYSVQTVANLKWERVDVVVGSLLTGVIGLAIAVACAATLHREGIHIEDASDAAPALRPLAGSFATVLFGTGLLGASLLAAAVVPLATAYSIAEGIGAPASLDLDSHHFQYFYAAFIGLTVTAVSIVSLPSLPLIQLIYTSQVVNAVLLPLHVVALQLLANDPKVVGEARIGTLANILGWVGVSLIAACVGSLLVSWIDDAFRIQG